MKITRMPLERSGDNRKAHHGTVGREQELQFQSAWIFGPTAKTLVLRRMSKGRERLVGMKRHRFSIIARSGTPGFGAAEANRREVRAGEDWQRRLTIAGRRALLAFPLMYFTSALLTCWPRPRRLKILVLTGHRAKRKPAARSRSCTKKPLPGAMFAQPYSPQEGAAICVFEN